MNEYYEDLELKAIKRMEQKERRWEKRYEELYEESQWEFEDYFDKEITKFLKAKKYSNKMTLNKYFNNNELLSEIPVDFVLKDNILNNEQEIDDIINKNTDKDFTELMKDSEKVTIEKFYYNDFFVSTHCFVNVYKRLIAINPNDKIGIPRRGLVNYAFNGSGSVSASPTLDFIREILDLNEECLVLDIPKTGLISYNMSEHEKKNNLPKKLKIRPTKKTCYHLYEAVVKNLKKPAMDMVNEKEGFIFGSINIFKFRIKHILCPYYSVRFHKPGFDAKFLINGQTKECKKI